MTDRRAIWAVAALAALLGSIGLIGSDALWLVPLGSLVAHGHVPASVPFAAAPTHGWHDVPAGAQLVLWALYHVLGGLRGLVVAQAAAAAVGFGALAAGLRREAGTGAAVLAAIAAIVGSLPAVVIVNASLFSLALLPVLLLLLESEARTPSRRIWLAVPLLALWGNLHGGVLTGVGLLACYLALDRARREPVVAAGVFAGAVLALFLTPGLWHTTRYYEGVFHSVVAQLGIGLWTPLGAGPFDVVLVVVAAALLVRSRPRLWEAVALVGLAAATAHVARNGTMFLAVAAYPAVRGWRVAAPRPRVLAVATAVLAAAAVGLLAKGPRDPGSTQLAALAARGGAPVLADPLLGQQVALAGGRVWVDNPVDAFRRDDQQVYLDWLDGKAPGAVVHARYVLVQPASPAGRAAADDTRLRRIATTSAAVLYRVR